jgi:hypothetical protein
VLRPRNAAMTALPCAPPAISAIMLPALRQRPPLEET